MTEVSPFASVSNNRFFSNSASFIESLKMVDVSSTHPSNSSDISKSIQMAFIEKVPVLNESKDGVQFFKSSQLSKVNESNNIFIEMRNEKKLCISEMLIESKEGTIYPQLLKEDSFQTSTILTSTCFDSKRMSKGTAE